MANRALDFTAGGQLFEAYWNMFVASLRPVLWAAVGCALAMWFWKLWTVYQPQDFYYATMFGLAKLWQVMGFDPDKTINVASEYGKMLVRIRNVDILPQVQAAMSRWGHILLWVTGAFIAGGAVLGGTYGLYAERLSQNTRKRTNERGAAITDAVSLKLLIEQDNEQKSLSERGGRKAPQGRVSQTGYLDAEGPDANREQASYSPFTIAGIPWPWRSEPTHFMAMGTTGTGKSTVLQDLLTQVRARKGRAVVFDLTGSFVERFYDPERDVILNALDERCPHWSIFHECSNKVELQGAANALIPHDGGTSEPFWTEAARMLFVEACDRLIERGQATNKALYEEIMTSVLQNLFDLVKGTVAGPISDPEAKRMAESVRGVLNASAQAIGYLPEGGDRFSIRDWVQNDDGQGGLPRRQIAIISASVTSCAVIVALIDQPTTRRENRSITAAT
jgi:hypothetical protein